MPREVIHTTSAVPFEVIVGWSQHGASVQVATTATDGTKRLIKIVNEWLVGAGMPTIDYRAMCDNLGRTTQYPTGPLTPAFDGWHADLDRAGVNRLIRTLRRARDQAFGRDE